MGNSNLSNSEKILVKVDQNNLMYIDPNSVMVNGEIHPRGVQQENLVMYVNLEADIVPRSILVSDDEKNTLKTIAKGTLNFLSSATGDRDYTTGWTDAYMEKTQKTDSKGLPIENTFYQSDESGQSFGIDSVSILVKGANFVPQVNINFIDVRGKTLFEAPENSPYNAFFHVPWPIFYLTVKGFYGKAIRYRLHLIKFNSKYNESNGNFEISTSFVGSTFAFMSDIPLKGVLNAPYMYLKESEADGKFNQKTGKIDKRVHKSSKGYAILKSVYAEMKRKKLIPQDFPVKTLREVGAIAETLDRILEQQIFNDVIDMRVLAGLQDYDKILNDFVKQIKDVWAVTVLDKTLFEDVPSGKDSDGNPILIRYYGLKSKDKSDPVNITGPDKIDSLEGIIKLYTNKLKESALYNNNLQKTGDKAIKVNVSFLSKNLSNASNYYRINNNSRKQCDVAVDKLIEDLYDIQSTFFEQKQKIERDVEKKMNEVVKSPNLGIGFDPTVRNLFAVLMANAEVYVRLMKEVHQDAFNIANDRKNKLKGFDSESVGESIYPWPEIKRTISTDKQKVIAYPGEPELRSKLGSDNPILWPEVAFIEEYIAVATNKSDPNAEKEGGVNNINYIFEKDLDDSKINQVSTFFDVSDNIPYSDRSLVSILFEIYERGKLLTLVDSFNNKSIRELVDIEFETIKEVISDETDVIDIIKTSVKSVDNMKDVMSKLSPFERSQYLKDSIPTQSYLKDILDTPFEIKQYNSGLSKKPVKESRYVSLNNELLNYIPESYRKNIYPFNSPTYKNYIGGKEISDDDFKFKGVLSVKPERGFITSPVSTYAWVKGNFKTNNTAYNLFTNPLKINSNFSEHILNTPYFHKQLFSDFSNTNSYGKYVGSAYLLLNSLPFLELSDKITFPKTDGLKMVPGVETYDGILMSSLFREVSSSHYIPYHLMVKWGSIYHRYKKKVIDGVDILGGFLNGTTTTNIDSNLFFNSGRTDNGFTLFPNGGYEFEYDPMIGPQFITTGATYSAGVDVGIHPFYDAIYHQVVNGYNHYNVLLGNSSYYGNVKNGSINTVGTVKSNNLRYWTSFVDNSKFNPTDKRYTVLPCDGNNEYNDIVRLNDNTDFGTNTNTFVIDVDTFDRGNQIYYRTIWKDNYIDGDYSGKTFFDYNEHNTDITNNNYSIDGDSKKVIDLIATFSPKILEEFEEMFLQFATEKLNEEKPYNKYPKVKYDKFQDLLKELVSVKKEDADSGKTFEEKINLIKKRQSEKFVTLTDEILSYNNLLELKLGNPKELDSYVIEGFIDISGNSLTYESYNVNQLGNVKYITLYIGEDIDGYYLEFFKKFNIEISEENVLKFRSLILIYGGYRKSGGTDVKTAFQSYISTFILNGSSTTDNAVGANNRFALFLNLLVGKLSGLTTTKETTVIDFVDGYNNRNLKIELYNFFKSFNDKWSSGNSIGQRLLMEEFLFLDKANKDIGDKAYLNLDRFVSIVSEKNDKANLFSAISMLIQGTGFDMRTLPAYVNFYGNNLTTSSKITPSSKVANNLFGTFLEVDYQESSPKTVIQFAGPSSKHLSNMNKKYRFSDDSFNISNVNNNPLVITLPQVFDVENLSKSNKVVAFEVGFGDQNQSIFKGISLDQSTIKNTSESFVVLENLARSESGAGTYNVDIGLFEYYRQASYSCEVTCLGNVMIQPTMFFYLKNIPMFRGSYWITEVSHNIRNNNITTTFKGSRIPQASLPDPEDSFVSSYKSLFDKLLTKAKSTISTTGTTTTEITISSDNGNFVIDPGTVKIIGETPLTSQPKTGISPFGVPYNGFGGEKYIQKVMYKQKEWFRAVVARMGSTNYEISPTTHMSIVSRLDSSVIVQDKDGNSGLSWEELKGVEKEQRFYSTGFQLQTGVTPNKIVKGKTTFLNPKNNKELFLNPNYSLNRKNSRLIAEGPVNVGPNVSGYGIGMSEALMKDLDLHEGEVVYFTIE